MPKKLMPDFCARDSLTKSCAVAALALVGGAAMYSSGASIDLGRRYAPSTALPSLSAGAVLNKAKSTKSPNVSFYADVESPTASLEEEMCVKVSATRISAFLEEEAQSIGNLARLSVMRWS